MINLQPLPDPEESSIEQEATQRRRQEVARELADQAIPTPAVPLSDAGSRSSDIRSVDGHGATVVSQDPLDIQAPADPEEVSVESQD